MTAPSSTSSEPPADPIPPRFRGLAWLALLLIVAIAGAGLVITLDHPATEQGRPELKARAHALVAPRLAALRPAIDRASVAVDTVAGSGRAVLTRLRTLDADGAEEALASGRPATDDLAAAVAAVAAAREGLLDGTAIERLPAADVARIDGIDAAVRAAADLPGAWLEIEAGAPPGIDLLRALGGHDASVVRATGAARDEDYAASLDALEEAAGWLRRATGVRNVANRIGLDVSTLDGLLARDSDYDTALVRLYTLMRASGGVLTDEARAALDLVEATQAALPDDQSALILAVTDLAGPTITPALLRIERARGAIDPLASLAPPASAGPQVSLVSPGGTLD